MNKLDESITKGKDRAHYINKKNTIIKKSYLYGLSVRDGQPDAARSDHFVALPRDGWQSDDSVESEEADAHRVQTASCNKKQDGIG